MPTGRFNCPMFPAKKRIEERGGRRRKDQMRNKDVAIGRQTIFNNYEPLYNPHSS
jgi:hypothetical protein